MRQQTLTAQLARTRPASALLASMAAATALITACTTPMPPDKPIAPAPATSMPTVPTIPTAPTIPNAPAVPSLPSVVTPAPAAQGSARSSSASTPRAYRADGAAHLYGLNAERIYKGKLPPLLYAVGVLNIEIDSAGRVTKLDWIRKPHHAPEVVAEIERTVRNAAPFPAPARMGKVVYTDTWLWHASGKFQLDTLTEGQN